MTQPIRSAEAFGRAVRARRVELGLTQDELAARCGVGRRFIVELEAGKPTTQLGKAITAANEVGLVLGDITHPASRPAPGPNDPTAVPDDDPLADLPRF